MNAVKSSEDNPVQCRVAVVGAGSMAREHLRSFADVAGVVLTGIYSRTRARAESLLAEFGVQQVCDSVEELYDRTHADLVVVTVPELALNAVSRICFSLPWTVLLEKPAGYNLADAEEIASAAHEARRAVFVALNRRLYSSTQAAIKDLASNNARRYIRVQDQEDQAAALAAGQPRAVVENWMYANSVHIIDYLRTLGRGRIERVRPVFRWMPDRPGVVVSEIEFDSGDIGIYEGIWDGPGPWAVTVTTTATRWEMRPLEQAFYQRRGERTLHSVEVHPWDKEFKAGFRRQAQAAVDAAVGQRGMGGCSPCLKVSSLATIDDALDTMRLISQIFS